MKKYKNIDDLFKSEVSGMTLNPPEEVWDGLASSIPAGPTTGRRRLFYGLSVVLLLLLAGGSYWIYESTEQSIVIENYDQIDSSEEILTYSGLDEIAEESAEESDETEKSNTIVSVDPKKTDLMTVMASESEESNTEPTATTIEEINVIENEAIKIHGYSNDVTRNKLEISSMNSRSIYQLALDFTYSIPPKNDPLEVQAYMKKRREFHLYTGLGASAAMMYYPDAKDQFTYAFDWAVGHKMKRFYIETGLEYQFVNEEANYRIDFKSLDSIGYYHKVISFEVDPEATQELIYNTKEVTVFDSVTHYTHATPTFEHEYLNIPLRIGFVFWERKPFRATVESGVIFSMLMKSAITNDYPLDPSQGELIGITRLTPERVSNNWQWMASVRMDYSITQSVSIMGQLSFRQYLNGIYKTEAELGVVKPYTMGLRFGIVYDF